LARHGRFEDVDKLPLCSMIFKARPPCPAASRSTATNQRAATFLPILFGSVLFLAFLCDLVGDSNGCCARNGPWWVRAGNGNKQERSGRTAGSRKAQHEPKRQQCVRAGVATARAARANDRADDLRGGHAGRDQAPAGGRVHVPRMEAAQGPAVRALVPRGSRNDTGAVQRSMRQRVLLSSPLVRRRRRQYSRS
jgi:hypothetical protein